VVFWVDSEYTLTQMGLSIDEISHYIEREILRALTVRETARFSEMRPTRVDSNLYSYHLKKLVRTGYIEKCDVGYRLSLKGLAYVDKVALDIFRIVTHMQPKITSSIMLKNEKKQILLTKRDKQPFINYWGLPLGKVHFEDETVEMAAERELYEKTGIALKDLEHAGDCYLRTSRGGMLISNVLTHVFTKSVRSSAVELSINSAWFNREDLGAPEIIPGINQMVDFIMRGKGKFEEIVINLE
jgi:8-oxo-dGTP pyrophosphatase MutT (NUDIX family)